ncbi:MAG TPA: Fe2+-dependent dioxygenase [Edaphobacter sp.]|nr:Fe2+-dependent dioxygenase [Edaphobacter sp.]
MLITIPDVLTTDQLAQARNLLREAEWVDGRVTAGHQSAMAKNNLQIPEGHPSAQAIGNVILDALGQNALFISAALPMKVFPPLFNSYSGGQNFGTHVDNAIRHVKGSSHRVRSDLSATLFLTAAEEYDGGELVIEDTYGIHKVKLPMGHMVLYPSSSLHRVEPVTRGRRVSSFFWIQSMIRSDAQRALLFDLDRATQRVNHDMPQNPAAVELTGIYHNLLRQWAEV